MKLFVVAAFAVVISSGLFAESTTHNEGTTSPVAPDRNKEADKKLKERISQISSNCAVTRGGAPSGPGVAEERGSTEAPPSSTGDTGVGGSTPSSSSTPSSGSSTSGGTASNGSSIFQSKCVSCHSTNPLAPKDLATKPKGVKIAALERSMAARAGLSDQEKKDVKAYFESLAQ